MYTLFGAGGGGGGRAKREFFFLKKKSENLRKEALDILWFAKEEVLRQILGAAAKEETQMSSAKKNYRGTGRPAAGRNFGDS